MRWKDDDLEEFKKRAEQWKKNGTTRTHLFPGVDIDRVHKNPKYRNRKTEAGGHMFASQKEAKRYGELQTMEKAGEIADLKLQVRFPIKVNDKKVCSYVADFVYLDKGNRLIVEDVKGYRTTVFILKAKLFEAVYGFAITEV